MGNRVYKLRPRDYWRIGEHENWFSEMAAKGCHLNKVGLHFVRFAQGEPKITRYRIELSHKKKMEPELVSMCAESGWDYVGGHQYFHVFSSPAELDAPEFYAEAKDQSFALKELDKKLVINASLASFSVIYMIGTILSILFLDGTPTLALVEGVVLSLMIVTISIAILAYTSIRAAFSIRALRKELDSGKPIDHHAPWKKHHRLKTIAAFVITAVTGLSAVIPFVQLVKGENKTLPETSGDSPVISLAQVEQNPNLVRGVPIYMGDDVDWANRYTYQWSPLAPVQYETEENGLVPGEKWKDGSGDYSPSIHSRFFQLNVPAMADQLISDLIKRYRYQRNEEDFVKRNHPSFDSLVIHQAEDLKEVFASKGNMVIYVRYYGNAKIDAILEIIIAKQGDGFAAS